MSEGHNVAVSCFVPIQLNCIELLSSQVQDEFIQTKVTHLWTESLHHVTEKFIKLFALNVAVICQRIKKKKKNESCTSPWVVYLVKKNRILH